MKSSNWDVIGLIKWDEHSICLLGLKKNYESAQGKNRFSSKAHNLLITVNSFDHKKIQILHSGTGFVPKSPSQQFDEAS